MDIPVVKRCECGTTFRARSAQSSRYVACPSCKTKHLISAKVPESRQSDDDILNQYMSDEKTGISEDPVGYSGARSEREKQRLRAMGVLQSYIPIVVGPIWVLFGLLAILGGIRYVIVFVNVASAPTGAQFVGPTEIILGLLLIIGAIRGILGEGMRGAGILACVLGAIGVWGAFVTRSSDPGTQSLIVLAATIYILLFVSGVAGILVES